MLWPSRSSSAAAVSTLLAFVLSTISSVTAHSLEVQSVSLPTINANDLGNLGVIGQFDAITRYSFIGQENDVQLPSSNDSIIFQLGNNQLIVSNSTNGIVTKSCSMNDLIYFAGNFTQVGSLTANGLASVNVSSGEVSAVGSGINGTVNTLYCDKANNSLYIGGENVEYENTYGVVVWDAVKKQFATSLFGGFQQGAIVNSIVDYSDNIIFGGSFNGLQNDSILTTSSDDGLNQSSTSSPLQQIGFGSVSVSAEGTASGTDPDSILCPGSGSNWSLTPDRQGTWRASFPWYFEPVKLRLYNLQDSDNGVKSWRFLAFPENGIMNFSYTDSSTGSIETCTAFCPLPKGSSVEYMDYYFVNRIRMDSFQLDINEFYGTYAGLSGIELFQDGM